MTIFSRFKRIQCAIGLCSTMAMTLWSQYAISHSTPSEFAEMSLTDLFDESILSTNSSNTLFSDTLVEGRWEFSYEFKHKSFSGYRNGTNDLSNADVLFEPGEQRTNANFPVLPTDIMQQVHLLRLKHSLDQYNHWYFNLPYIKQSSDHISSVDNYENFVIDSQGIGDISFVKAKHYPLETGGVSISYGLSLPTGSIDETGDTPRAPGNQQLPYTMQLGSGTFDIPLAINYRFNHQWAVGVDTRIRLGKNDRDYRLGNFYAVNTSYQYVHQNRIAYLGKLSFQHTERIDGQDDEITVPDPNFPFPASITNPDLFGGQKVLLNLGMNYKAFADLVLGFELGVPVYQDLNGPQLKENEHISVKILKGF